MKAGVEIMVAIFIVILCVSVSFAPGQGMWGLPRNMWVYPGIADEELMKLLRSTFEMHRWGSAPTPGIFGGITPVSNGYENEGL